MNTNFTVLVIALLCSFQSNAHIIENWSTDHITSQNIKRFVEQYKDAAIEQMKRTGVPASIILAQGGIESAWGKNPFAKNSFNFFGIHCHNTWNGKTAMRYDKGRLRCFRVYDNALQAFTDHANFLTNQPTKYKAAIGQEWTIWAKVLQADGYAENPNYEKLLIQIISKNRLWELDLMQV